MSNSEGDSKKRNREREEDRRNRECDLNEEQGLTL